MAREYLHTAKYGNPGGTHTLKPMFVKQDNHIFKSEYHPDVIANGEEAHKAIYSVKGNKVYMPLGFTPKEQAHTHFFTIGEGGLIHTTLDHPGHQNGLPVYVMHKNPDRAFIEKTIQAEAPRPQSKSDA